MDGLAVAAVLHQPELARLFADRVIGVRNGSISFDATAGEVDVDAIAALYAAEQT
jgi:phosphonate transport system ATP-binding protein